MDMLKEGPVVFEKVGQVGKIILNRPEKYNSLTGELALALQGALDRCAGDGGIRSVYLTGRGRAFCAGQDLQEVTGEEAPALETILGKYLNPIVEKIRGLELPVVCGVNGVAAGAGANIALACDITVARASAYFLQAFSLIGLIPDTGGTYFLPRLVGLQRASALMMLGEKVPAQAAAAMGMIYAAFPDEDFDETAFGIAERLSNMPTVAVALTKRALQASAGNDLPGQLALEVLLQEKAGSTDDYLEGVRAFLEKRKAKFEGR